MKHSKFESQFGPSASIFCAPTAVQKVVFERIIGKQNMDMEEFWDEIKETHSDQHSQHT